MADQKISELTALTGANAADDDVLAIVDTSAVETKKITRSELFKDTPSIGIGESSPQEQLHIHGGASATRLRISGGGLNNTYGGFVEGEGVTGSGGRLRLGVVDNSTDRVGIEMLAQLNSIVFNTGSSETEAMRIDSSGHAIIPAGVTLGTSAGVYAAANTLDDYEYGFFEPTYTGGTTNPSGITYDPTVGNEGYYVKVGRAVFIQINIRTDAISNVGAGDLRISGLPFASSSVSGQGGFGSFAIGQAADFAGEAPDSGYVSEGATHITLFYRSSFNGSSSTSQCSDLGTATNDNLIRIAGTYYVTV